MTLPIGGWAEVRLTVMKSDLQETYRQIKELLDRLRVLLSKND
jgi:hypothetical protein